MCQVGCTVKKKKISFFGRIFWTSECFMFVWKLGVAWSTYHPNYTLSHLFQYNRIFNRIGVQNKDYNALPYLQLSEGIWLNADQ